MGRTNRPPLAPGLLGSPPVLVPELTRVVRLTQPASQQEAPAWKQALPQPLAWVVLRLTRLTRIVHLPRVPRFAGRRGFSRRPVELAPVPPEWRRVGL